MWEYQTYSRSENRCLSLQGTVFQVHKEPNYFKSEAIGNFARQKVPHCTDRTYVQIFQIFCAAWHPRHALLSLAKLAIEKSGLPILHPARVLRLSHHGSMVLPWHGSRRKMSMYADLLWSITKGALAD